MALKSNDADDANAEKLYEVTDSLLKDTTNIVINKTNNEL